MYLIKQDCQYHSGLSQGVYQNGQHRVFYEAVLERSFGEEYWSGVVEWSRIFEWQKYLLYAHKIMYSMEWSLGVE